MLSTPKALVGLLYLASAVTAAAAPEPTGDQSRAPKHSDIQFIASDIAGAAAPEHTGHQSPAPNDGDHHSSAAKHNDHGSGPEPTGHQPASKANGHGSAPKPTGHHASSKNNGHQSTSEHGGHHSASDHGGHKSSASGHGGHHSSKSGHKTHSSGPKSTGSPSAESVWNPGNTTCKDLNFDQPPKQWEAADGDTVVKSLDKTFNNNDVFCSQCVGIPLSQCNVGQKGSPNYDHNCAVGLKSISDNRWDSAAMHYAYLTGFGGENCGLTESGCITNPPCANANGPGTWAVVKSLQTLNNFLYNVYEAVNDAQNYCNTQVQSFSSDFAPPPPATTTAWFGLLNSFIGLAGGMISIAAPEEGILIAFAGSLTNSINSIAGAASPKAPADTSKYLGDITQSMQSGLENVTNQLFKNGKATWAKAPDGSTNIDLADMMKNGQLMAEPKDFGAFRQKLTTNYQKSLFQQLAVFTWRNLDSSKTIPYIAYQEGSCKNPKGASLSNNIDGIDTSDTYVDFEGACYYLLGAKVQSSSQEVPCEGPVYSYTCNGADALPGGTHKVLSGRSNAYGGLTLQDIVVPSVKGWKKNGKKNGYKWAGAGGSLIKDLQDPGVVTLPVCDFVHNPHNPGDGCPAVGGELESDSTKCKTHNGGSSGKGSNKARRLPQGKPSRPHRRC